VKNKMSEQHGRQSKNVGFHGHFYQPPREEPFTNAIPVEYGATPYANFNEKITAECYRPNAEAGNFEMISFDLGPTLAAWLEKNQPDVYHRILASEQQHMQRYGVSNALAQAYNHTILPLATTRDKQTQIAWGLQDYRHRYGHEAHGMWLAETAVDMETLEILARCGVKYTILAPWQAAQQDLDRTEPYLVKLSGGRSITVFFYNDPASGGISFEDHLTCDANLFASQELPKHLNQDKCQRGEDQLLLIATDGELYGHHKPFRVDFLSHVTRLSAPAYGFEVMSLGAYLRDHPAHREITLHTPSSWSCPWHGVTRWSDGCSCDGTTQEAQRQWKRPLRQALNHLNERCAEVFEQQTKEVLHDPWVARHAYLPVRNGWQSAEGFWQQHGKDGHAPEDIALVLRTHLLLEAQYFLQLSFTSCGFFFEDLDRIEPRNCIAYARRAIGLMWQALGIDLQEALVRDLEQTSSWRTGITGAALYHQLPRVPATLLPSLGIRSKEVSRQC
jgi:alpha-amylase/alpha-mannosidase (GH57 family)